MSDYTQSPNPHRLYRNKERGFLGGVFAGMADYFNIDAVWLRLIAILLFLTGIGSGFILVGYILAWIIVPPRPTLYQPVSEEEDKFWRGVSRKPHATISNLRYAFRDMDERLQDIERTVTSEEWRLRREFKDLERS